MREATIFVRLIKDPLGLLPDRFEPTGELQNITLTQANLESIAKAINKSTLMSRIECLRLHAQLVPTADELHALALHRGAGTHNIEEDWELRAKVAEAELAAIYFKAEGLPARVRSKTGKTGVAAKLANDPKQAAKVEAAKLWRDWQTGRMRHKSGAAFARFICEKYPVLESPTTVERWARKWAAEKARK
ncbi:MAG: hypothetical protein ABI129_10320 [Rhodanobacter sp.]